MEQMEILAKEGEEEPAALTWRLMVVQVVVAVMVSATSMFNEKLWP